MVEEVDGRVYRLVVDGELGPRFDGAFDGMSVKPSNGRTEITGTIVDRAQLRALLARIDDLGLTLLEVGSVGTQPTAAH